jgi:hypothetical protein
LYSHAATYANRSSSRSASPSGVWYSSRKCPPHDLLAVQRVAAHQLAELEEVGHASRLLERLVQVLVSLPGR